jgi:hypothetical protein
MLVTPEGTLNVSVDAAAYVHVAVVEPILSVPLEPQGPTGDASARLPRSR